MKLYGETSRIADCERFNQLIENLLPYSSPDEVPLKINCSSILYYAHEECYRELMVSYLPMLPLLEMPQVALKDADYIIYMHPYARCEDASPIVLKDLKRFDKIRKEGAEIIVVGKAANAESLLDGSIHNITFCGDHFTEKLGKKFGINMAEKYFVYDDLPEHLAIWPVDGCLQKCKFCRRTYMDIKFESISLETIKENLDSIQREHPEWLKKVSLRAENLTEYGIDLYGKPMLHELLKLLNNYPEISCIDFPIGLSIGEITPEILEALCRLKPKVNRISLNLEAGSDRLLQLIGKKHTREDAIHVYHKIRESHPDAQLESTIMLGLPTEELIDIYALADLIRKTEPDFILCNYYVTAPKHPLAQLPQISNSLREYHLEILLNILPKYLRRDLEIGSWKIFKNKSSRKTVRYLQDLEEENKTRSFPYHATQTVNYYKPVSTKK